MPEKENQPRFASFLTMMGGVIIIFALISQIGKHTLPLPETGKTPPPAVDQKAEELLARRERAMVMIGALPRPTAAPADAGRIPEKAEPETVAVKTPAAGKTAAGSARAPQTPAGTLTTVTAAAPVARAASEKTLAAARPGAAPAPTANARYYQVRGGDTLFGIARKVYGNGSRWPLISQANKLSRARALTAGQKLLIPAPAETHTAWNRPAR